MDLWAWVNETSHALREKGDHRLADLVDAFPNLVLDLRHEEVDAAYPEALALARAAKSAWLEVFFRHWYLQSKVFLRMGASSALSEAVEALELAHRDEAKDCPQSVCVTQDLARCYGNLDGPGYVAERLAVADEALARIDPQWPCFSCISIERAGALLDQGSPGIALAYVERQRALLKEAGVEASLDFVKVHAEALVRGGRPQEALDLLSSVEANDPSESVRLNLELRRAWALASLGRFEEARERLPPMDAVLRTPDLAPAWLAALEVLIAAGEASNDARLHRGLIQLERRLVSGGAWRPAFDLARARARWAVGRGRPASAAHALAAMREALSHLKARGEAEADVERAAKELAAVQAQRPPAPAPGSPEEALEGASDDPEEALARLAPALGAWPADERIRCAAAQQLWALGHFEEAEACLRQGLEGAAADAPRVAEDLFSLLSSTGRHDEARALAEAELQRAQTVPMRALARKLLAREASRRSEPALAVEHLRQAVALAPDKDLVALLAQREREAGELESALRRLEEAVAKWPEPGDHDWERVLVATLLERWPEARASAKRLGFELEGEGPIDCVVGHCRVELAEDEGEPEILFCERTGPVTARVLSIAGPDKPQHAGDELVFVPIRIDEPPEEDSGEPPLPPIFRALKLTRPGGFRVFALEGVSPGEALVEELRQALAEAGARMVVYSDESYRLEHPAHGELVGFYARVAVPPQAPLPPIGALLESKCAGFAHPLAWPRLLELLGNTAAAHAQREEVAAYGVAPDP